MHQNFTHTDLIDRYLKGKLSDREQVAFEEKLRQDPLLADEISWQKDIYQALGETRRMALKSRLNQVPINQSPWATWSGSKIATTVGTLLVASIGSYYYISSSAGSPTNITPQPLTSQPVTYPQAYTLRHTPATALPKVNPSETVALAPSGAEAQSGAPVSSTAVRPVTKATPTIVRPEVVSEFAEDPSAVDYGDFEAPEKQTLQSNAPREEAVNIETFADSKYDFHYQFYDHKLFLHGDFDGRPYKIIALNTENDKKLFLEFNGAYYRIGEQPEVVPLVAIEDEVLVRSLRDLSKVE